MSLGCPANSVVKSKAQKWPLPDKIGAQIYPKGSKTLKMNLTPSIYLKNNIRYSGADFLVLSFYGYKLTNRSEVSLDTYMKFHSIRQTDK